MLPKILRVLLIIFIIRTVMGLGLVAYVRGQEGVITKFNIPQKSADVLMCLPPATGCFDGCLGKESPITDVNECGFVSVQCQGLVSNNCSKPNAGFHLLWVLFTVPFGNFLVNL